MYDTLNLKCYVQYGLYPRGGLKADAELRVFLLESKTCVEENRSEGFALTVRDYIDENMSTKAVNLIQCHAGIVDRFVWRKLWLLRTFIITFCLV